ncbi:unnamed protein product, partial [Owenia fusiformis]
MGKYGALLLPLAAIMLCNVACNEDGPTVKVTYMKKYKVEEYFTRKPNNHVSRIKKHLKDLTNVVKHYMENTLLATEDAIILNGTLKRIRKIKMKLRAFFQMKNDFNFKKIQLELALAKQSLHLFRGEIADIKTPLKKLTWYWIKGQYESPISISEISKLLNETTERIRIYQNRLSDFLRTNISYPISKETAEFQNTALAIENFYPVVEKMAKRANLTLKQIKRLKIPEYK